jgi:hypothetical protein
VKVSKVNPASHETAAARLYATPRAHVSFSPASTRSFGAPGAAGEATPPQEPRG